jgi:hypothetical protein
LRQSVEKYVNVMNEVAELYEADLIERRLFLGKRHVAIIQQAYFVEPYILWRNSIESGRWGLRILSIGHEARVYHWEQVLQQSAIRARVDPVGYQPYDGIYLGFCGSVGWMIGPGKVSNSRLRAWCSERRTRRRLNRGFTPAAKRKQNRSILTMPRNSSSGYAPSPMTDKRWNDYVNTPGLLSTAAETIRAGVA